LVLNDGRLQGVGQLPAEIFGKADQKRFVDQIAFGTVGQSESPADKTPDLVFHSNRGCKTAEHEAARFQDPPSAAQHSVKLIVITREVKYSAADNHVGKMIREGHMFQGLSPKVVCGDSRRDGSGKSARGRDGLRVRIDAKNLVPRSEEVMHIATETAARIEDFHAGHDAAAQELIEQVDIDLAELLSKGRQSAISGRYGKRRRPS
jgi:hypothetical protein